MVSKYFYYKYKSNIQVCYKQGWQSESGIRNFRFGFGFQFFLNINILIFQIGKILLEWQIQQISTNDKHLHEDFGIFNSLIWAFQNCYIDLKLGMMVPDTVRQNVERIATL